MALTPPRRIGIFADKIKRKSEGHYRFINNRILLLVTTGVLWPGRLFRKLSPREVMDSVQGHALG